MLRDPRLRGGGGSSVMPRLDPIRRTGGIQVGCVLRTRLFDWVPRSDVSAFAGMTIVRGDDRRNLSYRGLGRLGHPASPARVLPCTRPDASDRRDPEINGNQAGSRGQAAG